MNVFKRAFETTVEYIDQYKREQRLNSVASEFQQRIQFLLSEANDPSAVKTTPAFLETVALQRFTIGNPYTQLGLKYRELADKSLAKAQEHPEWSEDLEVLHKRGRVAISSILEFEEDL